MRAFWLGMAVHLWQTTLVLAVLALVERMLRRAPARIRDLLWSAGLVKLLLPIPIVAAYWPGLLRVLDAAQRDSTLGPALDGLGRMTRPRLLSAPLAPGGSETGTWMFAALTIAWGLGVAWLLTTWLVRARHNAARVAGSEIDMALPAKLRDAARDAGVPIDRIRLTGLPTVPSVQRLASWVVVISRSVVDDLSREELYGILVHERTHADRRDVLRSAVQDIAARTFFFYPPAWWLTRRLKRGAELACDEAVIAAGVDPRVYARALAKTIRLGLSPAGASFLGTGRSSLGSRFDRLVTTGAYPVMFRHRVVAASVFVFVLALPFVPLSEAMQQGAAAEQDFGGLVGSGRVVSLVHQNRHVTRVLEDIAGQAGFELVVDGVTPEHDITIVVNNTTVREVLELLARDRGYVLTVVDPSTLSVRFVGPRAARGPFRVGGEIPEPDKIYHVNPEYPELARRARLEGIVILQAVIDPEGNVDRVDILRGLGLGLDEAAEEAVRQWKYTPTFFEGRAVEVILTVTLQFQLIG